MKAIQYKDFYAKIKHITTFYWGGGGVLGALVSNRWYQSFKADLFIWADLFIQLGMKINRGGGGGVQFRVNPSFFPAQLSSHLINQPTYTIWKQANIFFSCGVNNEAYVDAAV